LYPELHGKISRIYRTALKRRRMSDAMWRSNDRKSKVGAGIDDVFAR